MAENNSMETTSNKIDWSQFRIEKNKNSLDLKIIEQLDKIKLEVKKKTGKSIDEFKPSFLERRINYRMKIVGILNGEEYAKVISNSWEEAELLYAAFSINVTKFFRDPQVWKRLEDEIIPKLITKSTGSSVYAWSCGSASGEEPHSISISLNDLLEDKKKDYLVYANDINSDAISRAKNGIYRKDNLVNVNTERLKNYFVEDNHGNYQVTSEIRNKIKFENIDMMKSSEKLFDIIFCRNVLIYYEKESHESIYQKFYESLKKDGVLVLGQDESMIGTKGNYFFETLYPKERIYKKRSS
ncbi:MAG: CheR family methyltransferase [Nitrosopumilus sp.]